jgi:pimeloyl-ACP methyl ester carboxylesterase
VAGHGSAVDAGVRPAPSTGGLVQPLTFSDCGFDLSSVPFPAGRRNDLTFTCAELDVPRDYANTSGRTLSIELIKVHDSHNNGSRHLVINPGGPGASGVEAAVGLAVQVSDKLLANFDLIGFDPRGVGLSTPVRCYTDAQQDAANSAYFDIRTPSGFEGAKSAAKDFANACTSKYGSDLPAFNTVATARDMDRIRAALGDEQLNYLGFSYGTELGGVYAHLYPRNVGVTVLDGAVDPLADDLSSATDQIKGFESAFDQFAADCAGTGCNGLGNPRQDVYDLIARAAQNPIPSGDAHDDRAASVSLILTGILSALYTSTDWPKLRAALADARNGRSERLLQLADEYNERQSDGTYSNLEDINTVISCNDSSPGPTDAQVRSIVAKWAADYPMFGLWAAQALFSCQQWQPKRTAVPKPTAPTRQTVLVVGNLHDPATPYRGAQDLTKTLGNAELLTWDGEGHTSYLGGSTCISGYVDDYLISGTLPPEHTTCPR